MTENLIHRRSDPSTYWSRTNAAEAMPGVLTPLGWTLWGPCGERAIRNAFYLIGALPAKEKAAPARLEDHFFGIFYGRVAARVDFLARIGDAMPGTTGAATVQQLLGYVPPDFVSRPSRRRWPAVAARFPVTFLRTPAAATRARADTEPWWRREVSRASQLSLEEARRQFASARDRFETNLTIQIIATVACIQPVYDQLSRLAVAAGVDGASLMTGQGSHDETAMVEDLWSVSRGRLDLESFLGRHGHHGPLEGELSSRVWREDPAPLHELIEGYRAIADDGDPGRSEAIRAEQRQRTERDLMAALPVSRRAQARLVLQLASKRLPLRGVCKTAFLQALDVARASARRIGAHLGDDHVLDDPEHVFYLTVAEVVGTDPLPPAEVIAERRCTHQHYQRLWLPDHFRGVPEPLDEVRGDLATGSQVITGAGASPGIAEGRVVVMADSSFGDFVPGDILVAHTTDPSWASIMFLAKALVVDIGGLLSHAAVVGRELGIPCVMGTGTGTRALRTGDVCRVDGSAGTVHVLKRADA